MTHSLGTTRPLAGVRGDVAAAFPRGRVAAEARIDRRYCAALGALQGLGGLR